MRQPQDVGYWIIIIWLASCLAAFVLAGEIIKWAVRLLKAKLVKKKEAKPMDAVVVLCPCGKLQVFTNEKDEVWIGLSDERKEEILDDFRKNKVNLRRSPCPDCRRETP